MDSELRQFVVRPGRDIPPLDDGASIHSASRTAMRIAGDATFTDSERHRQDPNAQMLPDSLGKPQGALTNPEGDQEPKLEQLGGHGTGT